MNQTIKLYETDGHLKELQAVVTACRETDYGYEIALDQTIFFPEGGGQYPDTGTIQGYPVFDVQETDGIVWHRVKAGDHAHPQDIQEGTSVFCAIDWERRFAAMQQHSGEHIVSGLIHKKYGYDNVGFHIGTAEVTLDFNGIVTEEELREIERSANEKVWSNLAVKTWYPEPSEIASIEYRSKKEIDGRLRLVEIPECDVCACCAPHVALTGEIGLIKLTGLQKYKGGVRISMQCGMKALEDYNRREKSVREISVLLSAKPDEVSKAAEKLKGESAALREKQSMLYKKLCACLADKIEKGSDTVLCIEEPEMAVYLRHFANLAAERVTRFAAVFAGNDEQGYQYILAASNRPSAPDMKPLAAEANKALLGRGGGSSAMVQGTVKAKREEIETWFRLLSAKP